MPAPASLRYPYSRVLLPQTRLAYIHLRNLLNDAKRDRTARISGYVAISMPEEQVLLYLIAGEVATATIRDKKGARPIPIASAIEHVPAEPEYGEICFHEADAEQLAAMYATFESAPSSWPEGFSPQDPGALFPYLMATMFDGSIEIVTPDGANYLTFRNGSVVRAFLLPSNHGTAQQRVAKLFSREGRVGDLQVTRWEKHGPLPVQAPPALVQAYRDLLTTIVQRLVEDGRDGAPVLAENARQQLLAAHPMLDGFSVTGRPTKEPLTDTENLTIAIAAWIRDLIWAAIDHDTMSPDAFLKDIVWDRRHVFQSAGLFDELPWKVI